MISKERLEELIKEEATIYDIFKGDIFLVDLTMAKYYDVPKYIEYKNDYYNCNLTRSIEDLFETKEEAEWYLEFGNITRTETLELPSWEDFKNFVNQYIKFYHNEHTYILESCFYEDGEETIEINCCYYDYGDNLLKLPLNKENYLKACRMAKNLFLGD